MASKDLNWEEKQQLTSFLMKRYRKSKNRIQHLEECKGIAESEREYYHLRMTKLLIDEALDELSEELRRILVNDYILRLEKNWYLDYYARSTYYRLKNKALDEFLHCLEY